MTSPQAPVLAVEGLTVRIDGAAGAFDVVAGVDLALRRGEILALVGESGSGKSMTALAVMGLLPEAAHIVAGRIGFAGQDLARLPDAALRRLRGDRLAMVFQEPMTSLNPSLRVGDQVAEALELHRGMSRAAALERTAELFAQVRIPDPRLRVAEYPHRMSGGMRQRVMIALALACEPDLVIADEPTTALDVTIQAQILDTFRELQARIGMAVLLITHDLAVVAETADRVAVMYAGRIVEEAPAEALFDAPLHPYTRGLLGSIPRLHAAGGTALVEIPGVVPPPWELPAGCAFAPRCPLADARCALLPPLTAASPERRVACWHSGAGDG